MSTPPVPEKAKRTLLVVDDDPQILRSLDIVFTRSFNVAKAASGAEALELLRAGLRPHVILCDYGMPVFNGIDFLEQSLEFAPDAVRAIITGFSELREILSGFSRARCYLYITKPWQVVEIIQVVRLCLQYREVLLENKRATQEAEAQTALLDSLRHELVSINQSLGASKNASNGPTPVTPVRTADIGLARPLAPF